MLDRASSSAIALPIIVRDSIDDGTITCPRDLAIYVEDFLIEQHDLDYEAWGAALSQAHHDCEPRPRDLDRKSTRLNSSHVKISYAVFCLKKKRHNLNE